jgi:hypothetical protein
VLPVFQAEAPQSHQDVPNDHRMSMLVNVRVARQNTIFRGRKDLHSGSVRFAMGPSAFLRSSVQTAGTGNSGITDAGCAE